LLYNLSPIKIYKVDNRQSHELDYKMAKGISEL
jgi:hypothetical protein